MTIPDHVSARWIDTLGDKQLIEAEGELHAAFRKQELTEKARKGERYILMQGPPTLVDAWHRWSMVKNEARSRGLVVRA